jgi:hypothetical protein
MGRRVLGAVAWGLAGLVVALMLTLGAFAIAGQEIAEPASVPELTPGATTTPDATPSQDDDRRTGTPTESPSPGDDRGGSGDGSDDDNSGSGSGGDDDNSGPGSGNDDNSGSGSDDSGSGSDSSGSGSGSDDSSGPGSGEHEDD